jgi:hypothetical protein
MTGYGTTVEQTIDNDLPSFAEQNAFQRIVTIFDQCLKGEGATEGSVCSEVDSAALNKLKRYKFFTTAIEQCYANIPADQNKDQTNSAKSQEANVGLVVNGVNRNQTKIEKELGLICSTKDAKSRIIDKVYSESLLTTTDYEVIGKDNAEDVKKDLKAIHRLLVGKTRLAKEDLIISIKKKTKIDRAGSFIDSSEIKNSVQAKKYI